MLRLPTGVRKENGAHDTASGGVNFHLFVVMYSVILFVTRGGRDGAVLSAVRRFSFRSGAGSRVRVQYAPGARPLARSEQRAYERHTPPLDTDSTTGPLHTASRPTIMSSCVAPSPFLAIRPYAFSSPSLPFLSKYPVSTFFHAPDFAPRRPLAPSSRS